MTAGADFAVIGAGMAGASAAYELAAHGSVRVLEMEATAGHHSTGRSAALYTECDGLEPLRRLAMASKSFLLDPPQEFATEPILRSRGVLFVAGFADANRAESFYEEQRELAPSIRPLTAADVVARCPVLRPDAVGGGVFEPGAMDIDVHTLHQGFLAGMRRRGGTITLSSPVTGIERRVAGWRVATPQESFDVDIVVNAAGAWCDLVGALGGLPPLGLQPKRRTAFTFAAPADSEAGAWPMVVDLGGTFYFRPEGPGLLASPMDTTPVAPQDIKHTETDVARAIDRIQEATTLRIRHVRSAWAGLRSFVRDDVPAVGMDPDAPGFFWLAGQGGYGIMTSPALGRVTAGLIVAGAVPDDVAHHGVSAADLDPSRLR